MPCTYKIEYEATAHQRMYQLQLNTLHIMKQREEEVKWDERKNEYNKTEQIGRACALHISFIVTPPPHVRFNGFINIFQVDGQFRILIFLFHSFHFNFCDLCFLVSFFSINLITYVLCHLLMRLVSLIQNSSISQNQFKMYNKNMAVCCLIFWNFWFSCWGLIPIKMSEDKLLQLLLHCWTATFLFKRNVQK